MSLSRRCVMGLVCVASLAGLSVAPGAALAQMPPESSLNRAGLTRGWWSNATLNRGSDRLAHMTVDDTHVFLQSSDGIISAFDAETGKHLWSRRVGLANRVIFKAASADDILVFISGLVMFGIDKDFGDTKWEMDLAHQPSTSPVIHDGRVFFGTLDGSLYAYDLKKISELQEKGKLPKYSENALLWRYRTSLAIRLPPVPVGNAVVFASTNGSLYSLGAERRKLFFQFETDAPVSAPMVQFNRSLLVASADTNFYSIDTLTGRRAWEYSTERPVRKAPVLIHDEVYLIPETGNMLKISATSGQSLWPRPAPRVDNFLAASIDKLYTVDSSNNLTVLSRDDGRTLGGLSLGRFTLHHTNSRSDRIYVATETGLVMCLHETGRDFPHLHLNPDRSPLQPELAPEGQPAADAQPPEPPAAEDQ